MQMLVVTMIRKCLEMWNCNDTLSDPAFGPDRLE